MVSERIPACSNQTAIRNALPFRNVIPNILLNGKARLLTLGKTRYKTDQSKRVGSTIRDAWTQLLQFPLFPFSSISFTPLTFSEKNAMPRLQKKKEKAPPPGNATLDQYFFKKPPPTKERTDENASTVQRETSSKTPTPLAPKNTKCTPVLHRRPLAELSYSLPTAESITSVFCSSDVAPIPEQLTAHPSRHKFSVYCDDESEHTAVHDQASQESPETHEIRPERPFQVFRDSENSQEIEEKEDEDVVTDRKYSNKENEQVEEKDEHEKLDKASDKGENCATQRRYHQQNTAKIWADIPQKRAVDDDSDFEQDEIEIARRRRGGILRLLRKSKTLQCNYKLPSSSSSTTETSNAESKCSSSAETSSSSPASKDAATSRGGKQQLPQLVRQQTLAPSDEWEPSDNTEDEYDDVDPFFDIPSPSAVPSPSPTLSPPEFSISQSMTPSIHQSPQREAPSESSTLPFEHNVQYEEHRAFPNPRGKTLLEKLGVPDQKHSKEED